MTWIVKLHIQSYIWQDTCISILGKPKQNKFAINKKIWNNIFTYNVSTVNILYPSPPENRSSTETSWKQVYHWNLLKTGFPLKRSERRFSIETSWKQDFHWNQSIINVSAEMSCFICIINSQYHTPL